MQAVSFEVPWASRLLPHASLWLAMFEMHPSRGGVPEYVGEKIVKIGQYLAKIWTRV